MNQKEKRIGLINYEGDAVWAKKAGDDEFVVYDQWDGIMEILTREDFFRFLDGDLELMDGEGKKWNFKKEYTEAKPSYKTLFYFIMK
jgi:hypothetical protein